jgi:hypothetical protein
MLTTAECLFGMWKSLAEGWRAKHAVTVSCGPSLG